MEKVNFEKKNVKILIFVIFGNPVFCQNLARAGWTMSFPIVKTCRKSPQKLRKVFLGEVGRAYKTIWGRGSPCWVARVPVWLLGWSEIQIRPRTDLASLGRIWDRFSGVEGVSERQEGASRLFFAWNQQGTLSSRSAVEKTRVGTALAVPVRVWCLCGSEVGSSRAVRSADLRSKKSENTGSRILRLEVG